MCAPNIFRFVVALVTITSNMLESHLGKIIVDFCSYFGKSAEILGFENDKLPEVQLKGHNEVLRGFRNIVSNVANFNCKTPEENVILDQWVEYAFTNAAFLQNSSNIPYILKEINEYMSDKVYFAGNKKTPADVLMYYFIYDIMVNFTFQDKEKYLNISRWFNNIQQDQKLRKQRTLICFSRTRLYA